jgi:hypothetical protein
MEETLPDPSMTIDCLETLLNELITFIVMPKEKKSNISPYQALLK